MANMNDLSVESYDANEVGAKKQSIAKRVAAAGSAVVLTLSLFSLAGCNSNPEPDPLPLGGAGAWFCSYPEDEHTGDE